ncbi:hypothetical protein F1188_17930 [Roseospira marina]|uniref:Uncharacterized protein n=1 Tax=Roseospira marina TaxID=140057 RepID=A0A5M6I8J5_9PROT|nr:hypothetical protein [Roseospira marina]KAA5604069.1 hypothetical protein F1188_17930 [Roseospira marina]MBB4315865.1 hypothetical protein [Roseospira marina]MBB5088995.1 hypothetical protein [Roseospira marina]
MITLSSQRLAAHIVDDLTQPVMPEARALADAIVARHGASVAAVLFYGSCLRTQDTSGILDLYVLTDDLRAYHGRVLPAVLNRIVPPTVAYLEVPGATGTIRAKVAVMGTAAFARAVQGGRLDTTLWARFCQPSALLYARDTQARAAVVAAVSDAVITASRWAIWLGPPKGWPADYWTTLFQHTYRAELRAEGADRSALVYGWAAERYDRLLPLALTRAGIPVTTAPDGRMIPHGVDRDAARRAWARRQRVGKLLNMVRLTKAVFTFEHGADYILWKLERHNGRPVPVSDWERRHPILAAPRVLLRLSREGFIR